MTSYFDEHEAYSSAIVTGDTQDTEHIPFRLDPASMIRGFVTDDAGDPVEDANVLLVQRTHAGGLGEHLVKIVSGPTDDNGIFEFINPPSRNPLSRRQSGSIVRAASASKAGDTNPAMAALDVAYPVTYYATSTTEAEATPIQIANGEQVQANVTLHAVPALHLTLLCTRGPSGRATVQPRRFAEADRLWRSGFLIPLLLGAASSARFRTR
jgi:hypothetical protein